MPSDRDVRTNEVLGEISSRVVQITRDHTGRGPTRARTYFADDLVSVVLQDALLKAERSLVGAGQADMVRQVRHAFQGTMRAELVAMIEELTGRDVVAFFSDTHVDPDIQLESFLLAPDGPGSGLFKVA